MSVIQKDLENQVLLTAPDPIPKKSTSATYNFYEMSKTYLLQIINVYDILVNQNMYKMFNKIRHNA